ncbi:thioredoxin family protein [Limibacter armeniacum]|uniref:thioredoxin family protein n=1 Tax=Limibacter armeniacum TaxID=466084 RepID=UPI002FE51E31
MKNLLTMVLLLWAAVGFSQGKLYHPEADARQQLEKAVAEAKQEGKHVLVQVGGNWCSWCIKFNKFVHSDEEVANYLDSNYVVVHLNYSPENKNEEILAELSYPQRFGFPVFVVLDGEGRNIHIQNSAYLEQDKGYSKKKVIGFFKGWAPAALDPKTYSH